MPNPISAESSNRYFDKVTEATWLLIFTAFVEDDDDPPEAASHSSWAHPNPFILGAVCKAWRRIALASTVLWGTPSISFGNTGGSWGFRTHKSGDQLLARVEALKVWVGRAGTGPLSIKVWNLKAGFVADWELAKQVPQIIIDHASQIVSLDTWIFAKWFPFFQGVEFPRLRTLKLCAPEIHLGKAISSDGLDFSGCTNLSVVNLSGSLDGFGITLPRNLTDASLSYLTPKDCVKVLSLLPNLQQLSLEVGWTWKMIEGEEVDWSSLQKRRSGSLGGLTSLALTHMTPDAIQGILNSLPHILEHLHIGRLHADWSPANDTYNPDDYGFLLQAIPPFACTLRSLKLTLTIQDTAPLIDLFPQLPELEQLEISTKKKWRGLYDNLFLRCFATAGILPRLLSLTFTGSEWMDLTGETIIKVLRYRWKAEGEADCVQIRNVRLVWWLGPWVSGSDIDVEPLDAKMRAEVWEMRAGGLNAAIEVKGHKETLSRV